MGYYLADVLKLQQEIKRQLPEAICERFDYGFALHVRLEKPDGDLITIACQPGRPEPHYQPEIMRTAEEVVAALTGYDTWD